MRISRFRRLLAMGSTALAILVAALVIASVLIGKPRDRTFDHEFSSTAGIAHRIKPTSHTEEFSAAAKANDNGDFREAERSYRAILYVEPESAAAHHGLGSALTFQRRYDEAEREYERSIEIDPQFAPSYSALGTIAARRGQTDVAISWYKQAVELDPTFGIAYWGLGANYQLKGDCKTAIRYLKRVPELLPETHLAARATALASRCTSMQVDSGDR
jgi:tetratricopeptide (TPR) repeat protein